MTDPRNRRVTDKPMCRSKRIEMALESDAAKAGFKIYMIFVGFLVSVLLTISTTWLGQMNARADALTAKTESTVAENVRQDQSMIKQQALMDYNGHRIDALERSSDATIQTLQLMTTQVTRLNDRMEASSKSSGNGP